ncbi:hypothetical protein [Elizabethkingia sp. JS20170427COW]|uniref:hypothetical protein n=1 Tax=Elizabethkingia sp. JS20170427COW TaxID=2583851 RepID=UPI0011102FDE|nr:hypothetical protein [Elizabethkingia sp. JS20170427COW]QCX53985.1 hypothetical protein FGE20_09695 [Elizabethkingia sp. JS20170427COW]
MENKFNEATPLRPQGDRLISGELLEIDLDKYIQQIKLEATWQEGSHNSITLSKSEHLRIVLIGLHEKAVLKPHSANGFISVQVIEGEIDFIAGDSRYPLKEKQMLTLHPKIQHSVEAKRESFFLLTLAMA